MECSGESFELADGHSVEVSYSCEELNDSVGEGVGSTYSAFVHGF